MAQIVHIVEAAERNGNNTLLHVHIVVTETRLLICKYMCVSFVGEPFLRFDLDRDKIICLETDAARSATSRILKQNNISSAKSIDLMSPEERAKILLLRSVGSANNSPHTSPKMKLRSVPTLTTTASNILNPPEEELEIAVAQSNL